MTPEQQERLRGGIAELRSGRFRQGLGKLHRIREDGTEEWCCLGVLSDYAARNGCPVGREILEDGPGNYERFGSQEDEYLSDEVQQWYGFSYSDPYLNTASDTNLRASFWNDRGAVGGGDFNAIADGFERTFLAEEG